MTIQHAAIADPEIHEPKGVSTASIQKVYVADGAGSGAWTLSAGAAHAEIYIVAGSVATALPAASAYVKINPAAMWVGGLANINTTTPANGEITLVTAGHYEVAFWVSFNTASLAAGTKYTFQFAINGVLSTRTLSVQKNTAGVDGLTAAAQGFVSATAGQLLTIHVAGDATSSGTNITILNAGFTCNLLKAA